MRVVSRDVALLILVRQCDHRLPVCVGGVDGEDWIVQFVMMWVPNIGITGPVYTPRLPDGFLTHSLSMGERGIGEASDVADVVFLIGDQ